MVMLTSVFDASGDKTTSTLAVAGFISSENDWGAFSKEWSERLARDGIEFFRAVDAAFFQGPFAHWHDRPDREGLRRALFRDLMGILKQNVYHRFGCVVINKSFDKMSEEIRKEFRLCSYSLAGLSCERQVRKYVLDEWRGSDPQLPLRIVFEHGDQGFGNLCNWLSSAKGTIPPSRACKKTVQEDGLTIYGFVPLQAADWLAYELALAVRHFVSGKVRKPSDFRWAMREFDRILGDSTIYSADEIRDAERKLNELKTITDLEKLTGLRRFNTLLERLAEV